MDEDEVNRGTVIINEIEASSRDEMRCPVCGNRSIEEHRSASEYPTKKAAILKASHCTNPDCSKNMLSPDEVDKQYSPSGIGTQLSNPKSLIQVGIAIVGVVLIASYFLGGPLHGMLFATPTATVDGSVVDANGNPVSNATVTLNGNEVTTGEDGSYTFEEVDLGEYTLDITPPEDSDMRSFSADVEVTNEGLKILGDTVPERLYSTENGFQTQLPSGVTISDSFKAQNTSRNITYLHPDNREEMTVTISPLESSEIQSTSDKSIALGESGTIDLQGTITTASASATGTTVEETYSQGKTTDSSGQAVLNVRGTMTPSSAQIKLGEGAGTSDRKKVLNIPSGGTENINVNGNVLDMGVIIRGGATDAPQQRNDVWSPNNGPIELTISEEDAPSTVTLTFKGDISTESEQTSGQLSNKTEEITVAPEGSLSPSDAKISFSGGNIQTETVASDELSGSAENGEQNLTRELTTVDQSGTYKIDYDLSATQGSEYVLGGYTVNGNKTEISGSGTESLTLESGDTVGIWLTLEQEEVETANHSDSSPIEVVDIRTNKKDNGEVAVWPKLENTSGSSANTEVVYYVDGNEVNSQNYSLSGGETTAYTNQYSDLVFTTSALSDGIHSIQVNEQSINVEIGSGSLDYGEGSISGELSYVADEGEIAVDANNDGNTECTTVASGGSCNINLSQGENTLSLTQNNVSGVDWTISYTARYGARDIQADMTGDGTNEINYQGVLADGETVSESLTFPAGTHEISVNTGNGESVPYNLEWTESGVISNPTLYVNDEEVINVTESYQGQREFDVNSEYFQSGENTIRLETEDDAEHTVIMEWSERGLDTFPAVRLANSDVQLCSSRDFSGGATCEIDSTKLKVGTQPVQFTRDGTPVTESEFEFTHTARAVPSTITLTNTETGDETTFARADAQETDVDGSWTNNKSVSNIQTGTPYEVSTTTNTQMSLDGSVTIEATAEREQAINPEIIIVHPDGSETSIPVPESKLSSNGELKETATINIGSDQFAKGVNKIKFVSENNGVYSVELVGVADDSG